MRIKEGGEEKKIHDIRLKIMTIRIMNGDYERSILSMSMRGMAINLTIMNVWSLHGYISFVLNERMNE